MEIEEALSRYLRQLEADGRSPHTLGQARRHVRMLARWLRAEGLPGAVEALDHEHVAGFLTSPLVRSRADGGPRKATAANALRSSLRAFFRYVHDSGYAATNPARLVRRAACGAPLPRGLSAEEEARLVGTLAGARTETEVRDRALIELMLRSGLRVGSGRTARVEDLDLAAGELRIRQGKGGREHVAFLAPGLVRLLREVVGARHQGLIFGGIGRSPLSARQIARRLDYWAKRAGITGRVSPHRLRHTFATRIHAKTGDLLLTQRAMGHASPVSTAIYAQVEAERVRAVVCGYSGARPLGCTRPVFSGRGDGDRGLHEAGLSPGLGVGIDPYCRPPGRRPPLIGTLCP